MSKVFGIPEHSWIVVDTETTTRCNIGSHKASPYYKDNELVLFGALMDTKYIIDDKIPKEVEFLREPIIMHNCAFDLAWWQREHASEYDVYLARLYSDCPYVWDTQVAAYLISGMDMKWASLNQVAEFYGLGTKHDTLKDYLNKGVDVDMIPRDELEDYLKQDLSLTHDVFRCQVGDMNTLDMMPLMLAAMQDRVSTAFDEYTGMAFNVSTACEEGANVLVELEDTAQWFRDFLHHLPFEFNPASVNHVSCILYGDHVTYDATEYVYNEDGTPKLYKSGKKAGLQYTKKVKKIYSQLGMYPGVKEKGTGVDVLKSLPSSDFVDKLLRYRELAKDYNTYYVGYSELVHSDGMIHPSINHCATTTGRQSCTNPNLQNVTVASDDS